MRIAMFEWELQYDVFKTICNHFGNGERPVLIGELNRLYSFLFQEVMPDWTFIGDINDPSKPIFRDSTGEDIYLCLSDIFVRLPEGVLGSTLLLDVIKSVRGTPLEDLSERCFYSFSKTTTPRRYFYDHIKEILTVIPESEIPATMVYFRSFKTTPVRITHMSRYHRLIALDTLLTDIIVKVSDDKTYIDYEVGPYENEEPFFKLSTLGFTGVGKEAVQKAINDESHNLLSFLMVKLFIDKSKYHQNESGEFTLPWGKISFKTINNNKIVFNFDCHNEVKASCHVFDTYDVVKGMVLFIEHEYNLRTSEPDIPNKNNFITLAVI